MWAMMERVLGWWKHSEIRGHFQEEVPPALIL